MPSLSSLFVLSLCFNLILSRCQLNCSAVSEVHTSANGIMTIMFRFRFSGFSLRCSVLNILLHDILLTMTGQSEVHSQTVSFLNHRGFSLDK